MLHPQQFADGRAAPALLIALLLAAAGFAGCGKDPALAARDASPLAFAERLGRGAPPRSASIPGSYIVAFRDKAGSAQQSFSSFAAEASHHLLDLHGAYLGDPRIRSMAYLARVDLAAPRDPALRRSLLRRQAFGLVFDAASLPPLPALLARVDFADPAAARSMLSELARAGDLWFAEPNGLSTPVGGGFTTQLAASYKQASVWWHSAIRLPDALTKLAAQTAGESQIPVIAVLDSGVDIKNPLLAGHIFTNPSPGVTSCGNDVSGCDTTQGKKDVLGVGNVYPFGTTDYGQDCPGEPGDANSPWGTCIHGTHVAGIIAANITNYNGQWAGGVCPVCQILPVKIIADSGEYAGKAPDSAIIAGLKYLTLFRNRSALVRVANMSIGKYDLSRAVALLVAVLKEAPNEVLVVAAASNEDSMIRTYPAAFPEAIGVAATTSADGKAAYSNFGSWVAVAAPGGDGISPIISAIPGSARLGASEGTSMASPVVAGVAGLVLAVHPERGWSALRQTLLDTADPRLYDASVNSGLNFNYYYAKIQGDRVRRPLLGAGIIDASAALDGARTGGVRVAAVSRVDGACAVGAPLARAAARGWARLSLLLGVAIPVLVARGRRGRTIDRDCEGADNPRRTWPDCISTQ